MKASHKIDPVFDDPNLVGCAGLTPAMMLAQSAGLHDLLSEHLTVPSPTAGVKATSVIAGMTAGADNIDDLDILRHGAMTKLFGGIRAPSTLGTYLRSFTHGHVRQLHAVSARFLAGLAHKAPGLLNGATDPGGIAFLDLDDTIGEVHGYQKQAAGYGYNKLKGLNAMIAALSTPLAAPVIVDQSLRKGKTASGSGSAQMLGRAAATARRAGVNAQMMGRADSAFYRHDLVAAMIRAGMWFSITARMNPKVKAALTSIPDDAWTPIKYPKAIWEEDASHPKGGYWVSDAEVAEVNFIAFTSKKKSHHIPCRLVVRRVKRHQPRSSDGTVQDELFAVYRFHAFITNSPLNTIEADERHRDHAIIEQVIAELKNNALAHLPSGSYAANAAWLAHAVMAFNLMRATGVLAGNRLARARWATLRRKLINIPARIATTGRRLVLHLPLDWPWAEAFNDLWTRITSPPPPTPA